MSNTTFVNDLHNLTGLNLDVLTTWAKWENGGNNNVLGVTSGGVLQSYATPAAGAQATANLLKSSYPSIIATAGQSSAVQASAIANSRWNTGSASGSAWYRNVVFAPFGTGTSSTPSGGASTPIAAVTTSTNPGNTSTSSGVSLPSDLTALLTKLGISTDPTHKLTASDIWKLTANKVNVGGVNVMDPNATDAQIAVAAPNNTMYKAYYDTLNGKTVADLVTNTASTGLGGISVPNIDITTAVYFIGVILVGVVFVGTGGLIALRKK